MLHPDVESAIEQIDAAIFSGDGGGMAGVEKLRGRCERWLRGLQALEAFFAQAEPGETSIPKERWGVHETHCCKRHGCKYGHEDCPVVVGLVRQAYPCEECHDDFEVEDIYVDPDGKLDFGGKDGNGW